MCNQPASAKELLLHLLKPQNDDSTTILTKTHIAKNDETQKDPVSLLLFNHRHRCGRGRGRGRGRDCRLDIWRDCHKDDCEMDDATKTNQIKTTLFQFHILWRLFHAASYENDWNTCFSIMEKLCELSHPTNPYNSSKIHERDIPKEAPRIHPYICAMKMFTQLQMHRPSLAWNTIQEYKHVLDDNSHSCIVQSLIHMYEAEAMIETEHGFHNHDDNDDGHDVDPKGNTNSSNDSTYNDSNTKEQTNVARNENHLAISSILKVMTKAIEISKTMLGDDKKNTNMNMNMDSLYFWMAMKNNYGISLVMAGKTKDAMYYFQQAALDANRLHSNYTHKIHSRDLHASAASSLSSSSSSSCPFSIRWRLLRPHFNFVLLIWREGYCEEASNVWLNTRGMIIIDHHHSHDNNNNNNNNNNNEHTNPPPQRNGNIWNEADGVLTPQVWKHLRKLYQKTIIQYNLLRTQQRSRNGHFLSHKEHIPRWQSSFANSNPMNHDNFNDHFDNVNGDDDDSEKTETGGMDKIEVYGLDMLLLRYTIEKGREKLASCYQKKSGGLSHGLDLYLNEL